MNQNDISAILPAGAPGDPYFLQNSDLISQPFAEEQSGDFTVLSEQFPNIFYSKRSMKILLEERSLVCEHLKLKLKSGQKKQELDIPVESMYEIMGELFKQSPTPFDPLHFVFIIDCGTAYGFFSGDNKYVPLCKKCNYSIYVVLRTNSIKIICCNPKCKIKILGETVVEPQQKSAKKSMKQSKLTSGRVSSIKSEGPKLEPEKNQRELTQEELNLIKKATKKMAYS